MPATHKPAMHKVCHQLMHAFMHACHDRSLACALLNACTWTASWTSLMTLQEVHDRSIPQVTHTAALRVSGGAVPGA